MKHKKLASLLLLVTTLVFTACSAQDTSTSDIQATSGTESTEEVVEETEEEVVEEVVEETDATVYPITITHAFGETVIEKKPERIATISWGNHDVPLALGVVPVGISKANYGVSDDSGLLPWTKDAYTALGVEDPALFDDVDGLDFEAISDAAPDVILAAYSGITQEEYDLLSQIAPVIAYPTAAWQTYWRDQILMDAKGMGMETEGKELVAELEALITEKIAAYPQLEGKSAAFCYFNPSDLGTFYVYLPADPRAAYLTDLGLVFPESVLELAETSGSFALELSAENIDVLKDVDVLVAYGNEELLSAMQADALLSLLPAVSSGAVALVEDGSNLSASCTPSALSIPATIDEYLSIIGKAADQVK
jgi:iron complex transport system substrate-binding protein